MAKTRCGYLNCPDPVHKDGMCKMHFDIEEGWRAWAAECKTDEQRLMETNQQHKEHGKERNI